MAETKSVNSKDYALTVIQFASGEFNDSIIPMEGYYHQNHGWYATNSVKDNPRPDQFNTILECPDQETQTTDKVDGCNSCSNVQDDRGHWNEIVFFRSRTSLYHDINVDEMSHTGCQMSSRFEANLIDGFPSRIRRNIEDFLPLLLILDVSTEDCNHFLGMGQAHQHHKQKDVGYYLESLKYCQVVNHYI